MGLRIGRSKTYPIGLDIGTGSLKLAQLRESDDTTELIAAASVSLPAEARADTKTRLNFLARSVPPLLSSNPFRGRRCVISLPASQTFVQHVKLSNVPADETANALKWELQGKLPLSVDDAIIRHVLAGEVPAEGQTSREVIAVAVARSVLEQHVEACLRARLDVVGVNIEPCAIVECFARLFRRSSDNGRAVMFLDLGASSTQVVLAHGEKLVFARNLAHGEEQFDKALAAGLSVPQEQAHAMRCDMLRKPDAQAADAIYRCFDDELIALCNELTQCLRYYESVFRNQPIERAIFIGGGAYDKRLCQSIAQRLNLPAQIGDPLVRIGRIQNAGLSIGLDRRQPQPDWTVAVGLSLGWTKAA